MAGVGAAVLGAAVDGVFSPRGTAGAWEDAEDPPDGDGGNGDWSRAAPELPIDFIRVRFRAGIRFVMI